MARERGSERGSEDGRQAEIARLEAKRDDILARAPRGFRMLRLISPIMLMAGAIMLIRLLIDDGPAQQPWGTAIMLVFLLLCARTVWRAWLLPTPQPGDLWGFSDRLAYEGDRPRALQAKIHRLREAARNQS